MSELINKHDSRATIRWKLLTGTSALALAIYSSSADMAWAEDASQPQVWIELGGDLSQLSGSEEKFVPPFMLQTPRPSPQTISPLSIEGQPKSSFGEDAKLSFRPEDSSWVFSAAIRYGRSSYNRHVHQQSYTKGGIPFITPQITSNSPMKYRKALQFMDSSERASENHAILDFQAGKDVGLGMFGTGGSSVFSLGVRFAQFGSKSNIAFKSDPDAHPLYAYFSIFKLYTGGAYHSNAATATARRSFHGVGPSLSWNVSAPMAGNPQDGQITVDWGINAALLFGRQRAKTHHQTTSEYRAGKYGLYHPHSILYRNTPPDQNRSRNVTVPNVGGSLGLSYVYSNAKISVGYKADFFFGALDGGVDARKSENRGFFGPYASISVGLGD